jgi:hypothetical protein
MMMVGAMIALGFMLVGMVIIITKGDQLSERTAIGWAALALISCCVAVAGSFVAVVGCLTVRFELVGAANQTLQATAAAPSN